MHNLMHGKIKLHMRNVHS